MSNFSAAGQDSFAIPRVSQKGFGEGTGRFTPGGSNKGSLKEGRFQGRDVVRHE